MHQHKSEKISLRPLQSADLALVLGWRNHPDVRSNMYSQHKIALEEHQQWYARCSEDPNRHLLIVESASEPFGFVNFTAVADGGIAEWGFYTAPDAPRGSGRKLGTAALDFAFGQLAFHKVCGQALAYNQRSIRFHESMGFRREGVLREQYYDGKDYHAVVCFGLLAGEWPQHDREESHAV